MDLYRILERLAVKLAWRDGHTGERSLPTRRLA
jgi:hypothetical protein